MNQNGSLTINHAAPRCSELFERILQSTEEKSSQFLLVEELRGRFRLWTA